MNKYKIGFSIKLPIKGVDYSNIETRFDWEEETELGFDEAIKKSIIQGEVARIKLENASNEWKTSIETEIESLNKKLEKAREAYINLSKQKNGNI